MRDTCQGAEIDKPNVHGSTPLHVACAEKKLFEVGVALLTLYRVRTDCIMYQRVRTLWQVSAYLLSQGASTECRNAMGDGALEIAQRHHNTEIAILISRHASRPVRGLALLLVLGAGKWLTRVPRSMCGAGVQPQPPLSRSAATTVVSPLTPQQSPPGSRAVGEWCATAQRAWEATKPPDGVGASSCCQPTWVIVRCPAHHAEHFPHPIVMACRAWCVVCVGVDGGKARVCVHGEHGRLTVHICSSLHRARPRFSPQATPTLRTLACR